MRKEKLFTLLRRLVIAALLVSAVFLLLQTDYVSTVRRGAAAEAAESSVTAASSIDASAALCPRAVAVCRADGRMLASSLNGESIQQAFRRFSAFLGEALGSAGVPEEITEASFRSGLWTGSVFVDLGQSCPLELLSDWLGIGAGGISGQSADLLGLGITDSGVVLSFRNADGSYFRCTTAAQAEMLSARIADFQAGSAAFAYENPLLQSVDPYMVILDSMPVLSAVSVSAPDGTDIDALTRATGMNSHVVTSYYDADGALVLNEDGQTLRLSRSGMLSYRASGTSAGVNTGDMTDAVNRAFRLAEGCAGQFCGDASIIFAGAEPGENDRYTVYFDYSVNGLPVIQPEGHAMTVVADAGCVRQALLLLRCYTVSEASETVLPILQAAAAAGAGDGGTPSLAYIDSGDHIRCDWIKS